MQKTLDDIKLKIEKAVKTLDLINADNFDNEFPRVLYYLNEVKKIKNEFEHNCPKKDVKEFQEKSKQAAKHLKEKFDSVIREKQNDIFEVSVQLKELNNKKKLVNYSR